MAFVDKQTNQVTETLLPPVLLPSRTRIISYSKWRSVCLASTSADGFFSGNQCANSDYWILCKVSSANGWMYANFLRYHLCLSVKSLVL